MSRRLVLLAIGLGAAVAAIVVGVGVALGVGRSSHAAQKVTGWNQDRAVPPLALVDERGRRTTLAAYRGKVVVFAPFLTLCHEVCPITTGAFLRMERAVRQAGLASRVVFLEVSVDPWRDTPARLRAYSKLTGVDFSLLTGSHAQLERFWRFFGVGFQKVPQGKPPDTDWLTGKPLTFDVTHTDALFFVGPDGREKLFVVGMGTTGGTLPKRLKDLLSSAGLQNLKHPPQPWTIPQALDDVGYLLGGARIPAPAA